MLIYKSVQTLIILPFAFFSDLRKKDKTKKPLNQTLLVSKKVIYLIPLLIFLFSVFRSNTFLVSDFLSLLFTLVGFAIVMVAKISLGTYNSWTGFGTLPKAFLSKGIYSIIRHPMYTGIFTCIIGM